MSGPAAEATLAAGPLIAARAGRARRALLRQGLREDLRGEVKLGPEELNALVREEVVVPAPVVHLGEVVARRKTAQQHHGVEVRDVYFIVLLLARVLLHHHGS